MQSSSQSERGRGDVIGPAHGQVQSPRRAAPTRSAATRIVGAMGLRTCAADPASVYLRERPRPRAPAVPARQPRRAAVRGRLEHLRLASEPLAAKRDLGRREQCQRIGGIRVDGESAVKRCRGRIIDACERPTTSVSRSPSARRPSALARQRHRGRRHVGTIACELHIGDAMPTAPHVSASKRP